jgi:hypothetical protein
MIKPNSSVKGYDFSAAVTLDNDSNSNYPQTRRDEFFCLGARRSLLDDVASDRTFAAVCALMIMPIKRDPKVAVGFRA